MHIPELEGLNEEELSLLLKVPAYITLLIGSADNAVDRNETDTAAQAVAFRTSHGDESLFTYYTSVNKAFGQSLSDLNQQYGILEPSARRKSISEQLKTISPVLSKLDKKYAHALLESWRGLARAVAQASGSVMATHAVSHEEMHLMGLNMIEL